MKKKRVLPSSSLLQKNSMKRIACTLILLMKLLHPSLGFSAWLPCNRYLEEDEVIMNAKVENVPTDEGSVVKLAVYDLSGARVDTESVVWLDEDEIADSKSISFNIRLDESTLDGLSDVQYVVETYPYRDVPSVPSSAPNAGAPAPRMPVAPSPVASVKTSTTKFSEASAGGGVMCEGKRSHARGKNGHVTFVIGSDALRSIMKNDNEHILSEVWAGWAEGHSKVTLTPKVYFKLKEKDITNKEEL